MPQSVPQKEDVLAALTGRFPDFYQSHTPLKLTGGEWRGPCPLHGGQGANFTVDPDTGHWYCHSRCQEGGDILAFVQKRDGVDFLTALERIAAWVGIAAAEPPRRQPMKLLDSGLARRAHTALMDNDTVRLWLSEHRGFTTETLELFQLGLLPPDTPGGPHRIAFPVYDAQGCLSNIRRHLFAYSDGLDRTAKTLPWEKGLRSDLYPISARKVGAPILLVEGEADALLGCQLGFCALTGTLGAGTWKPEWSETLRGSAVTILYDNDPAGQEGAQKAAAGLAGAGCPVRLAALPEGKGKDLTDWIVTHHGTAQDVQAALDAAPVFRLAPEPKKATRKPIAERIIDLADVQPPGDLPLLFGSYLLRGNSHWLTGQTGLGKSTLLYNMACALAEGTPLWGIDCEPTRVLYADMESGDVGRAHKIDRLYGSAARVRGQLLFLREPIKLPDETDELLAFVEAQSIELVIFDTARRCFSVKDENDNAEVYNRVVPTLDALKQIGVASLTLGHPSKNGNGSARGAGAQEDAGDVNLSLTMHRGEVTDTNGIIVLRVTKNRLLGMGVLPLYLQRVGDDQFERVECGDSVALPEPSSKRDLCKAALTEYLASLPTRHAAYTDIIRAMQSQGYTNATARRAKEDMEKDGELLRAVSGGYCLPDPFAE